MKRWFSILGLLLVLAACGPAPEDDIVIPTLMVLDGAATEAVAPADDMAAAPDAATAAPTPTVETGDIAAVAAAGDAALLSAAAAEVGAGRADGAFRVDLSGAYSGQFNLVTFVDDAANARYVVTFFDRGDAATSAPVAGDLMFLLPRTIAPGTYNFTQTDDTTLALDGVDGGQVTTSLSIPEQQQLNIPLSEVSGALTLTDTSGGALSGSFILNTALLGETVQFDGVFENLRPFEADTAAADPADPAPPAAPPVELAAGELRDAAAAPDEFFPADGLFRVTASGALADELTQVSFDAGPTGGDYSLTFYDRADNPAAGALGGDLFMTFPRSTAPGTYDLIETASNLLEVDGVETSLVSLGLETYGPDGDLIVPASASGTLTLTEVGGPELTGTFTLELSTERGPLTLTGQFENIREQGVAERDTMALPTPDTTALDTGDLRDAAAIEDSTLRGGYRVVVSGAFDGELPILYFEGALEGVETYYLEFYGDDPDAGSAVTGTIIFELPVEIAAGTYPLIAVDSFLLDVQGVDDATVQIELFDAEFAEIALSDPRGQLTLDAVGAALSGSFVISGTTPAGDVTVNGRFEAVEEVVE